MKAIANLLNNIMLGYNAKKLFILTFYDKNLINFLRKLVTENIILRFYKVKKNYKVYINNNLNFIYYKFYLQQKKKTTIKYKDLCKKQNDLSGFIFTNPYLGFQTQNQLLQKNLGGILVCKIV